MKRFLFILCLSLVSSMGLVHADTMATTDSATDNYVAAPAEDAAATESIAPLSQQNLYLFGTTLQAIREFYVDPVTDNTITENAVRGMLNNLDPHSDYLDEQDFADLKTTTSGEFSGVGVEITVDNGAILVISPIDDSPAAKAGIKAGDYIVKINGTAVEGLSLTKAINMMRGKKGEKLTLTVVRKGVDQPLQFTIIRDNIQLQDVKTKIIDGHYAYVRISVFEMNTGAHLRTALTKLLAENSGQIYGVILDLRNNPGGVVQAAVDVANVFLDMNKVGYNKLVVYTKGRGPDAQFAGYVKGHDLLNGLPLVVLINAGTASASEIVSGALQDDHRAIIMGVRSFGKGSVQTVFPLPDGKTAIKLTTARYYTPSGRSIQAEGIIPDVKVNAYAIPDSVKAPDDNAIREQDLSTHLGGSVDSTIGQLSVNSDDDTDMSSNQSQVTESGNTVQNLENVVNPSPGTEVKPLIYQDYQLYQAINVLEALHIGDETVSPTTTTNSK